MKIKAVIFDMDGVLLDSEPLNLEQIKEVCASFGKELDDTYLSSLVGRSLHDTWPETARRLGGNISLAQYQKALQSFPISSMKYKQALFPKIIDLLKWLKQEEYKIALASSSSMATIERILKACDINHYFDVCLSGEMFSKSKPDPQIYIETVLKLGLSPEECIIVEDSAAGIEAGKRANIRVVARVDSRFGVDPYKADYQVYHTYEVQTLLMKLHSKEKESLVSK